MLHLYDTLSRQKKPFKPLQAGHVGLYACGVTVYDVCHVGHARAMIVYDVLYRHLVASGFDVTYVRNITDVDDKIIKRAVDTGRTPTQVAEQYIQEMHDDADSLNVLEPTHEPKATDSIAGMIDLISQLIENGNAYPADNGDVYYSVKSFPEYGKLSGRNPDDLRAGERIAVEESKRDPLDFALWKASKEGEPSWDSPWGPGRPGWHIECSAMSREILGEEFDIHGGGIDLEFPHHENEIAQSEALSGGHFARYWVHNGLIRVDDTKMSKSLNNYLTIKDALKDYSGEELRTFMLGSHYRSPVNYTNEAMEAARAVLTRFYTALRHVRMTSADGAPGLDQGFVERFESAMNDDLNTPEALSVMHDLTGVLNKADDDDQRALLANTLMKLGGRLGLLDSDPETFLQASKPGTDSAIDEAEVLELIEQREQARLNKDFALSDKIRDQLLEAGIVLEDSAKGTTWRRQ